MDKCIENVIEFSKGQDNATVTLSQGRYKTRIRKLAKKYPEYCRIIAENKDGSLCAHIPTAWIRINPVRQLTEEQKAKQADVLHGNISYTDKKQGKSS